MISLNKKNLKQENTEKLNRENFRALMEAMSRPGSIHSLKPLNGSPVAAAASALLYQEVTWLNMTDEDISDIAFTTGSKESGLSEADYIFTDSHLQEVFTSVSRGTYMSPELGGTVFFRCPALSVNETLLKGPGINGETRVHLPVDKQFLNSFKEVNSRFPIGVDIFFIDDENRVAALARTTKAELV